MGSKSKMSQSSPCSTIVWHDSRAMLCHDNYYSFFIIWTLSSRIVKCELVLVSCIFSGEHIIVFEGFIFGRNFAAKFLWNKWQLFFHLWNVSVTVLSEKRRRASKTVRDMNGDENVSKMKESLCSFCASKTNLAFEHF